MINKQPSINGANGRDEKGQFTKGNTGGPGNPFVQQVAELRKTLLATVTPKDLQEVVKALLKQAKEGNIAAIRELLSRLLGPPVEIGVLARLEINNTTPNLTVEDNPAKVMEMINRMQRQERIAKELLPVDVPVLPEALEQPLLSKVQPCEKTK